MNPDDLAFVKNFTRKVDQRKGECFDASFALGLLLAIRGVPVRLHKGRVCDQKHWWLQSRDTIVDPTVAQFNFDIDYRSYITESVHSVNFESIVGYLGAEI